MWGPAGTKVWDRVKFGPRPNRGYDSPDAELPTWHVVPLSAEELAALDGKPLDRPLTGRHIRGSLMAVASLAGFAASGTWDPADPAQIELVDGVAETLEEMLRGFRGALNRPVAGEKAT